MTGNRPVLPPNNTLPPTNGPSAADHEKIITSLRGSLDSFILKLSAVTNIFEVSRPKTVLQNDPNRSFDLAQSDEHQPDRVCLTPQVLELDEEIDALLAYIGSQFSVWIFDNFMNSATLQNTLWKSFYYLAIKSYQQYVVDRISSPNLSTPAETEKARELAQGRFVKLCKHINHYYKVLITRMVETFGYTPQVHYVVSILQIKPENFSASPVANQKIAPMLHTYLHDSLCHMGDLSRYRSTLHPSPTEISVDYNHSLIYYTTASKIRPSSGVPLNQLGTINYSRGDVFTATYYFLRSVAVEEPFQDGYVNLKIILRKLVKMKNFSEKPLFGLRSTDDIEESYDQGDSVQQPPAQNTDSQNEVKENLLQIIHLYSSYFLAQQPTKLSASHFDIAGTQHRQQELSDKLHDLCKDHAIPSRVISKLVITCIIFVWLLSQSCEEAKKKKRQNKKASGALLSPREAYKLSVMFTLRIFDKLLSSALLGVSSSTDRKKLSPAVAILLPAFRILMDWTHKQMAEQAILDWGQDSSQCNAVFLKAFQILEHLRKLYGFKFDITTAVARSNWDRFEEILKRQQESEPDIGEADGLGKKMIPENYEETHCLGLTPLDGGINDTPSGLDPAESSQRSEQDMYRSQCLLFSGVEISRLFPTFLLLDEYQGQNAQFSFEPMELDGFFSEEEQPNIPVPTQQQQQALPTGLPLGIPTGPGQLQTPSYEQQFFQDVSYPDEEIIDESEYYKIGRNHAVFRTGNEQSTENRELFPKITDMNSASPAFLSKLYNLEQAQFSQKGMPRSNGAGNRGSSQGVSASPRRQAKNSASDNSVMGAAGTNDLASPKRRRRRCRGRRKNKSSQTTDAEAEDDEDEESLGVEREQSTSAKPPARRLQELSLDEDEDDDDDNSDEEVVFTGRGRGHG